MWRKRCQRGSRPIQYEKEGPAETHSHRWRLQTRYCLPWPQGRTAIRRGWIRRTQPWTGGRALAVDSSLTHSRESSLHESPVAAGRVLPGAQGALHRDGRGDGLVHCAARGDSPPYRQRHRRGARQRPRRAGFRSGPDRPRRVDQGDSRLPGPLHVGEGGPGDGVPAAKRLLRQAPGPQLRVLRSPEDRRPDVEGHGRHRFHRPVHIGRCSERHIRLGPLHPADGGNDQHRVAHGAGRSRLFPPDLVVRGEACCQSIPCQQAHLPGDRADEHARPGRPRRHENGKGAGLAGLRAGTVQEAGWLGRRQLHCCRPAVRDQGCRSDLPVLHGDSRDTAVRRMAGPAGRAHPRRAGILRAVHGHADYKHDGVRMESPSSSRGPWPRASASSRCSIPATPSKFPRMQRTCPRGAASCSTLCPSNTTRMSPRCTT